MGYTFEVSFGTSVTDFGPAAEASFRTLQMPNVTNLRFDVIEFDTVVLVWDQPATTDGFKMTIRKRRDGPYDHVDTNYDTVPTEHTDVGNFVIGDPYLFDVQFKYEDANGNLTTQPSNWTSLSTIIPSVPVLTIQPSSADEDDPITFTVTSNKTSINDIGAGYTSSIGADDNAETNDFTDGSGSILITPGNTSATFVVPTKTGTNLYEGDETFTLSLISPVRVTLGSPSSVKGTILEEQPPPQVSFSVAQHRITETNGTNYLIQVNVDPVFHEALDFTTEISGTAGNNDDYTFISDTHHLSAQQNGRSITTQIIDDNVYEREENAVLRITLDHVVVRVNPNKDTFNLIIDDNDPKPTLHASLHQTGTEDGQNQGTERVQGQDFANTVFKLQLQGNYATNITLKLEAIDGTAVAGQDYLLDTNEVTFTGSQPPTSSRSPA